MVINQYFRTKPSPVADSITSGRLTPTQVEEGNHGKIVAINLETGDFEVDASEIAACNRLEVSHPDAQIWMVRIGSRHVRRYRSERH